MTENLYNAVTFIEIDQYQRLMNTLNKNTLFIMFDTDKSITE